MMVGAADDYRNIVLRQRRQCAVGVRALRMVHDQDAQVFDRDAPDFLLLAGKHQLAKA